MALFGVDVAFRFGTVASGYGLTHEDRFHGVFGGDGRFGADTETDIADVRAPWHFGPTAWRMGWMRPFKPSDETAKRPGAT